jgi:hypothetical protein
MTNDVNFFFKNEREDICYRQSHSFATSLYRLLSEARTTKSQYKDQRSASESVDQNTAASQATWMASEDGLQRYEVVVASGEWKT